MPRKEKILAGIFLSSLVITLISTGYNLTVLMETLSAAANTLGWGAVILGCVVGSLASAVLWCACRHSVVRDELEALPTPPPRPKKIRKKVLAARSVDNNQLRSDNV